MRIPLLILSLGQAYDIIAEHPDCPPASGQHALAPRSTIDLGDGVTLTHSGGEKDSMPGDYPALCWNDIIALIDGDSDCSPNVFAFEGIAPGSWLLTVDVDAPDGDYSTIIEGPGGPADAASTWVEVVTVAGFAGNLEFSALPAPDFATVIGFSLQSVCPYDVNASGAVDVDDLLMLIESWSPASKAADVVDLITAWGKCP